ncbi:MAG: hypothetical protein KH198_09325 [Oscillibacter sp.]|nr:hypothetical protein [Oscillibacter sp.]
MKSIIWKIELAAAVLLAVSALVWGLRPGVWNYGGFYRMAAGEQGRTYTRPGCSTVEVTEDNRLRIQSPAGQTAEFTLSLAENGSYRAAEMAMDGVVRNVTYNTATGTFMTAGDSWSISTLVQEKAGFSPGLTDNTLYSMALGNHQTRIAGRPGEFLTAGLFLLLGLVLPLLLKPAIALDKFLLGFSMTTRKSSRPRTWPGASCSCWGWWYLSSAPSGGASFCSDKDRGGRRRPPFLRAAGDVGPYEAPIDRTPVGRGPCLPTVVPADRQALSCPPAGALPRNRLASSAAGGASAISPPSATDNLLDMSFRGDPSGRRGNPFSLGLSNA